MFNFDFDFPKSWTYEDIKLNILDRAFDRGRQVLEDPEPEPGEDVIDARNNAISEYAHAKWAEFAEIYRVELAERF